MKIEEIRSGCTVFVLKSAIGDVLGKEEKA